MARQIAIGIQSFEKIRTEDCFYIDKTLLIKEWWNNKDDVTLITRPRRFGKTLNMSMLECFFSNRYKNRGDLFEGLSIWKEEKYQELQGTYPVIFLSFANVKAETYEGTLESICENIACLYDQFDFLIEEDFLKPRERKFYESVDRDMGEGKAGIALHNLCGYLSRYYEKNVLILLDEYDTPMQEAYVNGYWDKMVGFIRNLFNSTFKTNPYMYRAIMTGITRVSKESIFSDFNNVRVVTTTATNYMTAFGFTEAEVFRALEEQGLEGRKEEVKSWYDGFVFGNTTDIYNPWSILSYLKEKEFTTYWANTSSNSLAGKLITQGNPTIKQFMLDLLQGREVSTEMDEQIVFEQLNRKKGAIWSLLLASGYLKVTEYYQKEDGKRIYQLALTNKEVRLMFEDMILNWFEDGNDSYNAFISALLKGDIEEMEYYMNQVALTTFSYFDTGKQVSEISEPERFYHGFVLGLLVELKGKYYLKFNRESGLGRYDVMLEPLCKELDAIIIEFKVYQPKKEKNLSETLASALAQIEKKQYDAELLEKGISKERIRHYGFAFEGKQVLIGGSNEAI
ncbi:MAG: AAA family ATPase [Clostridiales bacterium]|nr:AAA family ATPase [Clostridiales bacterium]